ncbi:thiosulfate oxidation carrier protein SoxY [Acidihalobacter prosperus]
MNMKRRVFLRGTLTASAIGVAVGAGLLTPQTVLAAWPKDAFDTKNMKKAMKMVDGAESAENGHVTIHAPDIAENGAVVPITVTSDLKDAKTLTIFTPHNPFPLNSSYELVDAMPYVSTRIKLAKSMKVVGVVRDSNGKLYRASKKIKVTIGGCGG